MFKTFALLNCSKVGLYAGLSLGLFLSPSALADEVKIRLSAYVPVECEVDLQVNLRQINPSAYVIGQLDQFCNTRYQMTFNFAGLEEGAIFQIKDDVVPVAPQQTLFALMDQPINAKRDIMISNVDMAAAERIASSLQVSVAPTGL